MSQMLLNMLNRITMHNTVLTTKNYTDYLLHKTRLYFTWQPHVSTTLPCILWTCVFFTSSSSPTAQDHRDLPLARVA